MHIIYVSDKRFFGLDDATMYYVSTVCSYTIPHYCITYRIDAHKAITGGKTKNELT